MLEPAIVRPLLESILTRSGVDGAYLYQFEEGGDTARLAVWSGVELSAEFRAVQGRVARDHSRREAPVVLHVGAWIDPRFAAFPEFWTRRFEGVISVPLIHDRRVEGLLNLCRRDPAVLTPAQADFLFSLSLPIGALLAAGSENQELRQQVEKLSQQLADRKLLDRAKGLLQARFSWTEEEAYLHLRRTSRQRRIAMREIALEVIERATQPVLEARHAS
jgi:signal transduction protein with GAF and PtsI domain